MNQLKRIVANLEKAYQHRVEMLDGVEHIVAPVVMIVDGVLNGALVTQEEYGRYVEAWNGVPVPVVHPEKDGEPISANNPVTHNSQNIGFIFNSKVDSGRLVGEMWINTRKATKLGYGYIINDVKAGKVIEVSTGYFCDIEPTPGEYNGSKYIEIHRNLRPDHLALLPNEQGACSVKDGCGVRVNRMEAVKRHLVGAIETLATAFGLRVNKCNCNQEDHSMDLLKRAQALKANGKLTQEHLDLIQGLDPEQVKMLQAIMGALATEAPKEPEANKEDPAAAGAPAAAVSPEEVDKMVANRVKDALARERVVSALKANSANIFSDEDLASMPVDKLEKYEASIRPVDYSGQGGFASHSAGHDAAAAPLCAPRGLLGSKKKEA
jgi:cytochrome c556